MMNWVLRGVCVFVCALNCVGELEKKKQNKTRSCPDKCFQ